MKLVTSEPESAALRRYLGREPARTSSAIATVEVLRAVRQVRLSALLLAAREVLARLDLLAVDTAILEAAAVLDAPLRTLDAIHLVSALTLSPAVDAFVCYDAALLGAARERGLPAVAPGRSA